MAVVTMRQLLEAGVHFGHQTRRWNPKMKRFIFGERNGIYIIDLNQTLHRVDLAYSFVRDMVANGGSVLFVGTKKQSQDPIARAAELCGMPYVNERWLGGMLTNFTTIAARVKKMQEYERMRSAGDFEAMPKKEALILTRELEKLERNLGGIRDMTRLPDAVFIIDIKKEHIAVSEANKMGIPIVAVVDTNCDPDQVQFPIPGNDDAIRSGTLMCRVISEAVAEGRFVASKRSAMLYAVPSNPVAAAAAAAPAPPRPRPPRPDHAPGAAPADVETADVQTAGVQTAGVQAADVQEADVQDGQAADVETVDALEAEVWTDDGGSPDAIGAVPPPAAGAADAASAIEPSPDDTAGHETLTTAATAAAAPEQ
jgi:small subunit ribosomal protein S2